MAFALPPLPYDYTALEPHIDEQTMRIHHDKHHAAYVNNLNAALEPHPDLQKKTVEELIAKIDALPEGIRAPVRNSIAATILVLGQRGGSDVAAGVRRGDGRADRVGVLRRGRGSQAGTRP